MRLLDLVGNTPLVDLQTGSRRPEVRLLGKLEGNNPAGSVKDRPARAMILGAEARGELRPGTVLIEPTSGNTGIALAMVAAARGYPLELVMPEDATAERMQIMRAYGARLTLSPAPRGMEGAIDRARERAATEGYLLLDQFRNPDNWRAHYERTGPEIWSATGGAVTHFVSAMGTTGTIMGVSRYLKERNPEVVIVGCQPGEGARIAGIRRWPPAYLPAIYEPGRVDRLEDVDQVEAASTARQLAREEGVFAGPSAAGAVRVARRICAELDRGVVVCILPDRGDRYLSSPLFEGAGETGDGIR
ncbi:MAG: cysteine synthase CysM [Myxococcota bacterium]